MLTSREFSEGQNQAYINRKQAYNASFLVIQSTLTNADVQQVTATGKLFSGGVVVVHNIKNS